MVATTSSNEILRLAYRKRDRLTELMARNVHDIWSVGRIADGWTWGPQRDDARKENPCLVPYEELPESEKAYDRNTSIETLRLILSLGYKIEKI